MLVYSVASFVQLLEQHAEMVRIDKQLAFEIECGHQSVQVVSQSKNSATDG
jgi:hypothetical protein